ncbi:MAG: response regulator transcription factor [Bacteroidetes bacterium]|nr:MAG: response regulator transcription factor [Bacteroidota bacterium]
MLVALQTARYRLLILDHAEELYIGLTALLFTVVGIWAGRHFTSASKTKPAPSAEQPLSEPELEQVLARHNITPREYEVLQFIAQGLSNQEIADRMFVSLNTIKTHTSNLFSKLDVQRRTQAVQKARALRLLGTAQLKG